MRSLTILPLEILFVGPFVPVVLFESRQNSVAEPIAEPLQIRLVDQIMSVHQRQVHVHLLARVPVQPVTQDLRLLIDPLLRFPKSFGWRLAVRSKQVGNFFRCGRQVTRAPISETIPKRSPVRFRHVLAHVSTLSLLDIYGVVRRRMQRQSSSTSVSSLQRPQPVVGSSGGLYTLLGRRTDRLPECTRCHDAKRLDLIGHCKKILIACDKDFGVC